MNIYDVDQQIKNIMASYEEKAKKETDVQRLTDIYNVIGQFNVVRNLLWSAARTEPKPTTESAKGRKVFELNARNRAEANAAFHLVKEILDSYSSPLDPIHETVYVTNEGAAYYG